MLFVFLHNAVHLFSGVFTYMLLYTQLILSLIHVPRLSQLIRAVLIGPPFTLSPTISFYTLAISLKAILLTTLPACFCAVGPPLTGSSFPVNYFSASVIFDMIAESRTPDEALVLLAFTSGVVDDETP